MLYVTFHLGQTRFVIDAGKVTQVVARVPLRVLPLTEPYVAGLLDFRGTLLVVVDLSTRLFGTHCAENLSTRIIIVRIKHGDREVPMGLIAEHVTRLSHAEAALPEDKIETVPEDDCLGRIVRIDGSPVQRIEVDRILSEPLRRQIFEQFLGQ
jgi:chemotaxis-related protein WspB